MARIRTHPGEILREKFLIPLGLSARAMAKALGVPANRVTEIMRGEDVKQCLSAVVPAQAGTHTPQRGDVAAPTITETLVVMGPRLRGDDSG